MMHEKIANEAKHIHSDAGPCDLAAGRRWDTGRRDMSGAGAIHTINGG